MGAFSHPFAAMGRGAESAPQEPERQRPQQQMAAQTQRQPLKRPSYSENASPMQLPRMQQAITAPAQRPSYSASQQPAPRQRQMGAPYGGGGYPSAPAAFANALRSRMQQPTVYGQPQARQPMSSPSFAGGLRGATSAGDDPYMQGRMQPPGRMTYADQLEQAVLSGQISPDERMAYQDMAQRPAMADERQMAEMQRFRESDDEAMMRRRGYY